MDFGTKLKALRQAKEMSQEALARAAGISTSAVTKIEQNRVDPGWQTVLALADALGVSTEAFREQAAPPTEPAKKGKARK